MPDADSATAPAPGLAKPLASSPPGGVTPLAPPGPVREVDISGIAARVRLGANRETAPELLLSLAADEAVTVRAAVAMNAATPLQVDRLLALDQDERVRTLLARKLASLLPSLSDGERNELQTHAMATLSSLVADEAVRVRAAIADVVKEMAEAPRGLILRLAKDSAVSVCDPVIRLSPLLTAEDLITLLEAAPSPATAIAVARRPGLPEPVSDAVAATAHTPAITALLSNQSAAVREATLDALIQRAGETTEWQAPLVRRPLLSAAAARALSDVVATHLLDELCNRADLDPAITNELRGQLLRRLESAAPPPRREPDIEQAMELARRMYADSLLDEARLLEVAQRGEARLATAMLAVAADVPVSVVDRAATLRSAKGLISLVWRAGFSMRAAGPLQTLLARLSPDVILRATANGGFPLAVEEMRWQLDFLTRMGR
jgi:uncharacterized protein (DUF2336 family)